MKNTYFVFLFVLLFLSTLGLSASNAAPAIDYEKLAAQTKKTLGQMVEANTTNPPGNESKIVKIVEARLKEASIPFEVTEFAPGRQNIVARLKSSGLEKPILILAHIDVVGTANQTWTVEPHKMTEKDGYLYGRGVLDDLGMAALSLETLIALRNSNVTLRRDIILALTGDEESGGAGIQYILKNKPATVEAAFALNEGGGLALGNDGKVKFVSLQVAEKIYQDFEIVAKGTTGHSSVPLKDNAIYRLSTALDRLGKYQRPARLIQATKAYYLGRAEVEKPPLSSAMRTLAMAKGKLPAEALKTLEADPIQSANLRTTCVATIVTGGTRVNSLPAEAKATVNCRILPDEDKKQVLADLVKVINDPSIEVKEIVEMGSAPASPVDGEGPVTIMRVAHKYWPGIPLVPTMSRGATDSRFLRAHGIPSYGISPIAMSEDDSRRAHGVDERIPIASVRMGGEFFHQLLLDLAAQK